MNETLFQIAVVFLPGLLWLATSDALMSGVRERSPTSTAVRAFGFGVVSYFVWFLIYFIWFRVWWGSWPTFLDKVTSAPGLQDLRILRPKDIFFSSILSVALSIAWAAAANRKLFLYAMQKIGVTRKFGSESVWEFTLNLREPAVEYAHIRDFTNKILYAGYIRAFSEGEGVRELLLQDVIVYDLDTAQKLFETGMLYLSLKPDSLHIEYPFTTTAGQPGRKGAQ
jgi:hypothetical protein